MTAYLTHEAITARLFERFSDGFLRLNDLPSPFLLPDMQRAAGRIAKAIQKGEKIAVVGDYDADGVVSTTLMRLFFKTIEYPIEWIVPNRFTDGYGISPAIIDRLDRPDVIITVDNGIAAFEAANRCLELGIDLIITDHHLLADSLPKAYAVVDQKRPDSTFPFDEICGAQITWYLIAALKQTLNLSIDLLALLDLVAIAIVADVMPLTGINRAMVQAGLQMIARSKRPAVCVMRQFAQKDAIKAEDIAFLFAPILNSAGRMADASDAVDFLLAPNIYEAQSLFSTLVAYNERRKEIESKLTQEALCQASDQKGVIVVWGKDWHEGVVGIVAARVAQAYRRPALVLSENDEGRLKGSGRSFGSYDLFALIDPHREVLERFGGHKAAVGLSLQKSNLSRFQAMLSQTFKPQEESMDGDVLGALRFATIDRELIALLDRFEPFGAGNPRPLFATPSVRVVQCIPMGKEKNHARYFLEHDGVVLQAVAFRCERFYQEGDTVDVIYSLSLNRFRETETIQLRLERIA